MSLNGSPMISPAVSGLAQRIKLWRAVAISALAAIALVCPTATQAQTSIFNTFYVGTLATGLGTSPTGIALDSAYNLYVAESNLDQIGIFNASGVQTGQFIGTGTGLIRTAMCTSPTRAMT